MKPIDKQKYLRLLLEEKDRREKSINISKDKNKISAKERISELSSYDNHPGDLGTETFEAEKELSFRIDDRSVICKINKAIEKVDKDKYGFCEFCNKQIQKDRLEVLPYVEYCINCEEQLEKENKIKQEARPIEEGVISPSFGKTLKWDREKFKDIQFDGEDTWQALNQGNVLTSDNPFDEDDTSGCVQDVESISNQTYKNQIE